MSFNFEPKILIICQVVCSLYKQNNFIPRKTNITYIFLQKLKTYMSKPRDATK